MAGLKEQKTKQASNNMGKELKELRVEAKFTQLQLANKLGISRETISAIENEHVGTIESLSLEIIKNWWAICRKEIPQATQQSFIYSILRLFHI